MKQMTDVAGYIYKEMIKNLDHKAVKRIHGLHNPHWSHALSTSKAPRGDIEAMIIWRSLVAGGKTWDHKAGIIKKFGHWSYDRTTDNRFNFDIWSNIHYGYVGKYAGFRSWTLKAGAGAAQVGARTNPPGYWDRRKQKVGDADFLAAFDDPADQVAIALGIKLWESKGRKLTLGQLVDAVRGACDDLNTIGQCSMPGPVPAVFKPRQSQSFIKTLPTRHRLPG